MKSLFRIDPINRSGKFDLDFFTSQEYVAYRSKLEEYLEAEGFYNLNGEFQIEIFDHLWLVNPNC